MRLAPLSGSESDQQDEYATSSKRGHERLRREMAAQSARNGVNPSVASRLHEV